MITGSGPALAAPDLRRALSEECPKAFFEGTERHTAPARTVAAVLRHREAMGITRVGNVTGLDRIGIPVYCAVRPNSWSLAVSQGKGLSKEAAKASALMEATELWHAERPELRLRWAGIGQMQTTWPTVDPGALVKHSRPDDGKRLAWVEGQDLLSGEPVWVPLTAVHCDDRLDRPYPDGPFQGGTNGLASGNVMLEAVVHALCELIERDALAAWDEVAAEEQAGRRVKLDSIDDPACSRLVDLYRSAGVEPIIWNVPSPAGVPTFDCQVVETSGPALHPLPQASGAGTHPVARIALARALTEAAQVRATIIAGSRDSIPRAQYDWYYDPAHREAAVELLSSPSPLRYEANAGVAHQTFNEDLDWLLDKLRVAGYGQVVVVDLSKPAIGVPVVKVIVPGLRWRYDLY